MFRVHSILISPVKSLRMTAVERVQLTADGFEGDRAWAIVDAAGRVVTMREAPQLARVIATRSPGGALRLEFPGEHVDGIPSAGEPIEASLSWGATIPGRVVDGPHAGALSRFLGMPVRLLRAEPSKGFDAMPVSLTSTASLDALARATDRERVDPRRMRLNLVVDGAQEHAKAHEEDEWIGRTVRIGGARIAPAKRDVRCRIVDQHPETGDTDMATLKAIVSYRQTIDRKICFGVYARVVEPGAIAVGDPVAPE